MLLLECTGSLLTQLLCQVFLCEGFYVSLRVILMRSVGIKDREKGERHKFNTPSKLFTCACLSIDGMGKIFFMMCKK